MDDKINNILFLEMFRIIIYFYIYHILNYSITKKDKFLNIIY
jgi:hypothetical protein